MSQELTPSRAGAQRRSAHPRIHAVQKPYSRPSSFAGLSTSATLTDLANVSSSLLSPSQSPTKGSASTTRGQIPSSSSHRSLPRSGSDSSLFSGFRSILSRPLQWLTTPGKTTPTTSSAAAAGGKRDSLSSFGNDLEDPESPSQKRDGKRIRRISPEPPTQNGHPPNGHGYGGAYDPEPKFEVQGRAVSGFMLPPLSPNVTLKPKSHLPVVNGNPPKALPPYTTNFSRPLASSKSMSYLDPPTNLLGGPSSYTPKRGGVLTRSKRVELSSFDDDAEDDDTRAGVESRRGNDDKGKGKEEEKTWSPWKSRYANAGGAASNAASPRKTLTPSRSTATRLSEKRDYTLPSASPFKAPPSPLVRQGTPVTSGLTRSATTTNVRRAASVATDISMGRTGSVNGMRHSSSMLFGSVNGDNDDDRMSVDGDQRQRESSVLDWFMKERWDQPGSPASIAASRRLGSAGPSNGPAPLRKGQLVWHDEEKAFVRESELRASKAPQPVHKNEAERILYTLENMHKTPLTNARKADLPQILGQSSRTIRKTINVPLATAAAGDNAKSRRDRERLGDEKVSVMISPYGRRKVADQIAKDARRQRSNGEHDQRSTQSVTPSDALSDTHSQASDVEMEASSSQRGPSPSAAPAPTPRRSSRLKRNTTADEESDATPKPRRTRRGASKQPETVHESQPTPKGTTRRTRKGTVERGTSPEPPPPIPTPSVPTITATAPSPGQAQGSDTYRPRADGDLPKERSSLRARSDASHRQHVSAASYSRSTTPSTGRFSAREEDLPDMDELEQAAKIPLPSFSGISFAGLSGASTPTTTNGVQAASTSESGTVQPAPEPKSSLSVAPPNRKAAGPLARLGVSSTRPRASSPLAAGSIVAQPESPPTMPKPKSSAEPIQPPANGFFSVAASTPSSSSGSTTPAGKPPASTFFSASAAAPAHNGDASKGSFSFGLGKPPTAAPAPSETASGGGVPDFFGKKSAPASGTVTPAVPSFDFGISKKAEEPKAAPAKLPTFSFGGASSEATTAEAPKTSGSVFGAPASSTNGGFSFNAPKETTPAAASSSFSFSASKPAETNKAPFSFGSSSNDKSAETSKPAFSFGSTSSKPAADKPAEAPKATFSFGAPAPAAEAPKSAEAAKPAFSFGAPSTSTPFGASTNGTAPATTAAPAFGGFSFNKPADDKPAEKADKAKDAPSNPFGAPPATSSNFTFGAPASTPASTSSPFGASQANGPADASKSNPFGSTTPAASTGFTFGASSSTPAAPANGSSGAFGSSNAAPAAASNPFGLGASATAAPASNPFGSTAPSKASAAASPAVNSSFTFGANNASSTPGFGSAPSPAPSNPFGGAAQQPATPTGGFGFTFGAGGGPSSPAPTTSTFGFGQPAPAAPSTPGANASSTFSFGTPANGAAPSSTFGFGSNPAPAAPPSSAGGVGGFGFGAPAPVAAPAAAPQAQRFGSPAPADGGFSLGSAEPAPSSPGGRRVKGLPRRAPAKR
ncbi:hypothetical protein CI109_105150 [Kwoniella shandongensis]|uniref:Uncharacterized protein n=1 Tax=Kwoniella shandongensis TaxID=1734106 RepID=A0A5M6C3D6_9TREE|nr:uncharacterized protein CI109_001989 [Kwoniella shandongensis]KAA5529564.1 hypothetical protein CI109_001989 [Kwoniella shandongensis]